VLRNWERIKQLEHRKESRHSALDGVPKALPALIKAQRTQEKAARGGFDWDDADGPLEKIGEELAELKSEIAARKSERPADSLRVKEELGDLIFSVCNLARHLKVDSESALAGTTEKFSRRFRAVEAAAKSSGRDLKDMSLAEMDELWENAKKR
jgi:MazG family protein